MIDHKNGGPAFPVSDGNFYCNGMTLRDYFAAAALQVMYASDTEESFILPEKKAPLAYRMADLMLKEREK